MREQLKPRWRLAGPAILALALFGATASADVADGLKASLDQSVGQLVGSCQAVHSDAAVARFAAEHGAEPDFRQRLGAPLLSACSLPVGIGWSLAEEGVSPDKSDNKIKRTCTPVKPKPADPAEAFLAWATSQPPEFMELPGLKGVLIWASAYFDCKPA